MCGVLFCASSTSVSVSSVFDRLSQANAARGPDAQRSYRTNCEKPSLNLHFFASELRLRGIAPILQPHMNDHGNILCWNGEIFDGLEITPDENDGVKLFEVLCQTTSEAQVLHIFSEIEGPFAFVFYHIGLRRIFFGRDPLGRRSLLIHAPSHSQPYLIVSSVSAGTDSAYDFKEVSTEGIFQFKLQNWSPEQVISCQRSLNILRYPMQISINQLIPPDDWPCIPSLNQIPFELQPVVDELLRRLGNSVLQRVRDIPNHSTAIPDGAKVAVLFSGGIDSTVVAALADRYVPAGEPIDLLNVAFENPRKIQIQRQGNSGGPTNKKKKGDLPANSAPCTYRVPDRITGAQELEELRRLSPTRRWNFVEINVPFEESRAARQHIESLLLPSRTVMDLSLGLALYFASRAMGEVRQPDGSLLPYSSPARVLLNGLGSDELLGGYGRHRSVFYDGGWAAVAKELQLEVTRLPTRNLGRDDRVISSHGKETRHPFLSLDVVKFLASLPVQFKLDPRLEVGMGDKLLLRFVAHKLGLVEASTRKKRAMQFGSHSARMDGEGDKGGDIMLE